MTLTALSEKEKRSKIYKCLLCLWQTSLLSGEYRSRGKLTTSDTKIEVLIAAILFIFAVMESCSIGSGIGETVINILKSKVTHIAMLNKRSTTQPQMKPHAASPGTFAHFLSVPRPNANLDEPAIFHRSILPFTPIERTSLSARRFTPGTLFKSLDRLT